MAAAHRCISLLGRHQPPPPQQPPLPPPQQPQQQQRQPEAAGVPSLVWALALAILALLVRKLLKLADSA